LSQGTGLEDVDIAKGKGSLILKDRHAQIKWGEMIADQEAWECGVDRQRFDEKMEEVDCESVMMRVNGVFMKAHFFRQPGQAATIWRGAVFKREKRSQGHRETHRVSVLNQQRMHWGEQWGGGGGERGGGGG